jgi:hypothetical protein
MCTVRSGNRNPSRSRLAFRLVLFVGIASCVLVAGSGRGAPRDNPNLHGPYEVEFRGVLSGRARATVSASNVHIHPADLHDSGGNVVNFHAPNLRRDGHRFSGDGTSGNLTVRVVGRIDPATETLTKARLVCTFEMSDKLCGRALGWKP